MTITAHTYVPAAVGGSRVIRKGAAEVVAIVFNWASMLDSGETITGTPAWTITPGHSYSQANTTTTTTVTLTGGASTEGGDYDVQCSVATTSSRTYVRAVTVQVRTPPN